MKNFFIMALSLFACFACSQEKVQSTEQEAQCCPATGECPVSSSAMESAMQGEGEVSGLAMQRSPYDFSSIENFRRSVLFQADVEGLDMDLVVEAVDSLSAKLIDDNMEELSKCETEEEADEAMMRLLMKTFSAKKLREILEIKE